MCVWGGVARCERDATMTHQRSTGLTSIHSLFESIVYDDLYSSSDGVFLSPFHVTCTFLGGPTPKPLLPLYATVISSHPPPRPLVRHHRRLSSASSAVAAPLSSAAINATPPSHCNSETLKLGFLSPPVNRRYPKESY